MGINKRYFTCLGKGHGAPALPATREDWEAQRKEPWLLQMCERIRRGDDELKHRLPIWTPSCAEFHNNHRAAADALKPLSRLMMDFDEKGHTDEILIKLGIDTTASGESTAPEVGGMKILLVEESVRGGTHTLVELPTGMTPEEAQELMKQATGFTPDPAVKDVSRCIYMVPQGYTRFVSEQLFEVKEESFPQPATTPTAKPLTLNASLTFKGIPYVKIIDEWWNQNGGEPAEGERNVKLHKLAVNLRAICDNKSEVLMQIMPRLGLAETELKSIVDSACKEQPKGISKQMQLILNELTSPVEEAETQSTGTESSLLRGSLKSKNLPIGLRESLIGVPTKMQLPVLCSVLPIAAAYADQVEVEYCDGNLQRLGLMSIIRGEQASGKSVCKNAVDIWKRQFDEEDALARKREEEWKERKKGRKANEKAPEDPKVLIRMVPVTVSCSTLLKRLKNAGGHTLYSFGEELDTLRKTNGAGSWSSKYDIYRLSFDQGEWGQDYNSDAAESGVVKVAYNWTMLGTNGALRRCFKSDNIENGLSSRVLISEMPDSSFQKMPKFGRRSIEDEARIQEAVNRLRSCTGHIDTPRLRNTIEQWVEEKRVEAAKDIDHVKDIYRKRAAVIGFRCGVVFHLLTGEKKETKQSLDFARMMAEYTLMEQIKAFGEALQNQFVEAREECQRYGSNHSVFDQLPPVFCMDDLRALKRGFCGETALRTIITRWRSDGWIEKTDAKHWTKMSQCHIATLLH